MTTSETTRRWERDTCSCVFICEIDFAREGVGGLVCDVENGVVGCVKHETHVATAEREDFRVGAHNF